MKKKLASRPKARQSATNGRPIEGRAWPSKKTTPVRYSPGTQKVAEAEAESLSRDFKSVMDEISVQAERKRLSQWMQVQCPYCGESFDIYLDTPEDGQSIQEDCHICCRPIQLSVQVEDGEMALSAYRA